MRGELYRVLCVLTVTLLGAETSANDQVSPLSGNKLEAAIDALAAPYERAGMFNGVVLVAKGDQILLQKGYGDANYEHRIRNQPSTRFRIASLSKQITNAAIGTLFDSGIVKPDSKLSEFLPTFPRADEITIRQLVEHTSGVPHTNDLAELEQVTSLSLDEMVRLLATKPLDFDPGTDEKYSNGGYDILAAVIEQASGKNFESYLADHVFSVVGLHNTGRLHTFDVVENLSTGYLPGTVPASRTRARFYPAEIRIGGGSIYSTAEDVFRLFRATFQRDFASDVGGDLLFWDATKRYEITGRSPGFVAKVFIDIPRDITIVSLANNYSFLPFWGRRLYQAAVDDPWEFSSIDWSDSPSDGSNLMGYEGLYESNYDLGRISKDGHGNLVFEDVENNWRVAMIPLDDGLFLHPFFDTICEFTLNDEEEKVMVCKPVLSRIDESTIFRHRP